MDLDQDEGEGVGKGNVAKGLEAAPDFLGQGVDVDADSGEATLEPSFYCLITEEIKQIIAEGS